MVTRSTILPEVIRKTMGAYVLFFKSGALKGPNNYEEILPVLRAVPVQARLLNGTEIYVPLNI